MGTESKESVIEEVNDPIESRTIPLHEVPIVNDSGYPLPKYETPGAAGFDIRAKLSTPVQLHPRHRTLIHTGLYMAIPRGYELQIRPRSGLALKKGLTVLNSPGTIDSDYRGEIGIILINHGSESVEINPGDKIAQGVLSAVEYASFVEVDKLEDTERGEGGFGHTGK